MPSDAEKQLERFIEKFDAEMQAAIRAMRKAMRKRIPGANELVYDNYNFLVIGYGPGERTSQAILSLGANAKGVNLFFLNGAALPDPQKILLGSGSRNRFVRLESVKSIERPEVAALIAAAVAQSDPPVPAGKGKLLIRSVSAKQRPRKVKASAAR